MDSFELNKIIGAILGTLLFVMGVGFLAEAIYHPSATGPGYALPEPEVAEGGPVEEVPMVSIGTLLASADPVEGANQARKCTACHDFSEANTNKSGPGLYDVVERVIGSHPDFAYSAVMAEHQANGDIWTYDNLNHFLLSPRTFAPGTKMTFAGLPNDQERANIIAYLSTLSASPKPFPAPDAADEGVAAPDEQIVDGTLEVPAEGGVEALDSTDEISAEPPGGAPETTEEPAAEVPAETAPVETAPAETEAPVAQ